MILEKFTKPTLKRLKDIGLDGSYYFDDVFGIVFDCFAPEHPLNRRQYAEAVRENLKAAREVFGSVQTEMCISRAWDVVDYIGTLCEKRRVPGISGISDIYSKGMVDEAVFFTPLVAHSLVLYDSTTAYRIFAFGPKRERALLREVEYGAMPCFSFSTRHSAYSADAFKVTGRTVEQFSYESTLALLAKRFQTLCSELADLQYVPLERHQEVEPGLFKVSYSNGREIVINYNEFKMKSGSFQVSAESYKVI
ncbi:MAG: DUF5696 domain-containing protein [Candidatus Omnitrophota bacterium]